MKIAGQRDSSRSSRPRQNSKAVSQRKAVTIVLLRSERISIAWVNCGIWQANTQTVAPVTTQPGRGCLPSNTRAPLQAIAYDVNSRALERSSERSEERRVGK